MALPAFLHACSETLLAHIFRKACPKCVHSCSVSCTHAAVDVLLCTNHVFDHMSIKLLAPHLSALLMQSMCGTDELQQSNARTNAVSAGMNVQLQRRPGQPAAWVLDRVTDEDCREKFCALSLCLTPRAAYELCATAEVTLMANSLELHYMVLSVQRLAQERYVFCNACIIW
jgi:hypothetical protein